MLLELINFMADRICEYNPEFESVRYVDIIKNNNDAMVMIDENGVYSGITDIVNAGAYIRIVGSTDYKPIKNTKFSCSGSNTSSIIVPLRIVAFTEAATISYPVASLLLMEKLIATTLLLNNNFNKSPDPNANIYQSRLERNITITPDRGYSNFQDILKMEVADNVAWSGNLSIAAIDLDLSYEFFLDHCESVQSCNYIPNPINFNVY